MGREFFVMLVWEGNGKEMLSIISKGRKWEGNNMDFPFGRENVGKMEGNRHEKGNPVDPCNLLNP